MNNLDNIQSRLKAEYPELLLKYPIKNLSIFGSYVRKEETDNSDIDLLVEFSKPIGFGFFELAAELEKILGNKVDLVSRNGIKPHYFAEIESELVVLNC